MTIGIENGLQHLIWLIQFDRYAPGVVFGFFIEVPLACYILFRIIKEKSVARWYLAVFGLLILAGTIHTLTLGDKPDPGIRNIMIFSKSLARFVFNR